MATHEITIHQNTGATSDKAPYLGNYVTKDTIGLDALAGEIAAESGLPAIQTRAILEGQFESIAALERESLVRANFDGFAVCGAITGSLPTSDAELDPKRNRFVLAIRLDDSLRLALVNVTPSIVTDATTKRVAISEVSDIAEPRPYSVLHGQRQFLVTGYNIVLTDEGSALFMQDRNGTIFELVVDEALDPQKIKAHTSTLLDPGDYKVVIKSRGGDEDGQLQTRLRKVKYLAVASDAPVVNAITSSAAGAVRDRLVKGSSILVSGLNFSEDVGDVAVKFVYADGTEVVGTVSAATPRLVTVAWPAALDSLADGTAVTLTVTRTRGGATSDSNTHNATVVSAE